MKKLRKLVGLLVLCVIYISCEQGKKNAAKDIIYPKASNAITFHWSKNDTVQNIKKGHDSTILIASSRAVFCYNGHFFTNLTTIIGAKRFNDVLQDRNGGYWFATADSGVYHYNARMLDKAGQEKSFQHFTTREGIANNSVVCIYEQKDGVIWFGTASGVTRYDPRINEQVGKSKSFQNFTVNSKDWWENYVTTFMEDKAGKLWVATRGHISIYDGGAFTTLPNGYDQAFDVWSIVEDRMDNIWFGGWDGLRRHDGQNFIPITHNSGYNFIIEDKAGNIWTSGLVNRSWALSRYNERSLYNKEPAVIEIYSGQPGTMSRILEADDGGIWFGKNGGLYRYDGKEIHVF